MFFTRELRPLSASFARILCSSIGAKTASTYQRIFVAGTNGEAVSWSGMGDSKESGDSKPGGGPDLNEELDRLQEWVPHGVARVVRKVRSRGQRLIAFRSASR